jgi:Winged helix DNA-binding domain
VRRISAAERRARLGLRHALAPGALAASPAEVATSLVAVHGTDPSSVYLGILGRMAGGSIAAVERALYEDKTLIRLLGMRRTVFVTTLDGAAVVQAACSDAVAASERRKLLRWLTDMNLAPDTEGWLAGAEQAALDALAQRGEATAAELATDDKRLAVQVVLGDGASMGARFGLSSRVLFILAAQGKVARGRPNGSWTSHQYQWTPLSVWCPDGLPEWTARDAEVELARRWLHSYGPATVGDLQWWTGWTKTQVRRVLSELKPAEVDLDGVPGIMLASELDDPVPAVEPWAALLPGLDSTPMGWRARDWYLGEHAGRLFDQTGNIGPSLWWNGRIVGGWAQDRDGQIVCRFLEDAGSDAAAAAQRAAARLASTLGGVRLAPRTRGRTWLEQELAPPVRRTGR